MTYNPQKYSTLLSAALPSVIDSIDEYNRIEEIFNNLFKKIARSKKINFSTF